MHWVTQVNRDRLAFAQSEAAKLHQDQAKLFDFAAEASPEGTKRARDMLYTATKPRTDAIKARLAEMRATRTVLMTREGTKLQSAGRSVILTLALSFACALAFGITVSVFLTRRISNALYRLTRMIQDIAEGDGDVTKRLEMAGGFSHDELGEVSRLFNLFMDKLQELLRGVVAHTHKLATASEQLLDASQQITTNSGETAIQANAVSRVTQQVSQNLQSLSTGAGEMTSTIQSIAANTNEAAKVASTAVNAAQAANATVTKLGQSSAEIGISHQGHYFHRAADQPAGPERHHRSRPRRRSRQGFCRGGQRSERTRQADGQSHRRHRSQNHRHSGGHQGRGGGDWNGQRRHQPDQRHFGDHRSRGRRAERDHQ